ncbi:MAG TPA: SIMPL domain-containing protein, partial [Mycobacteriales bacterium]|nr:SIMPL domain-containing protein [Mycobacteriales bacterium]
MVDSVRTRTVGLAVVAALGVAVFFVFGSGGGGRQARADSAVTAGDTVSVQGTGTVQGVPDRMTAVFGVHATRGNVQDALDAVAHDAQRVVASLRHAGVGNADMRTTDLELYPHYNNNGGRDGYDASETVTATFHDLGTAGRHISATVASAGNAATVNGLSFDLSSDTKLLAEARSAAFA